MRTATALVLAVLLGAGSGGCGGGAATSGSGGNDGGTGGNKPDCSGPPSLKNDVIVDNGAGAGIVGGDGLRCKMLDFANPTSCAM